MSLNYFQPPLFSNIVFTSHAGQPPLTQKGSGQSPIEPVSPMHCTVCANQIQVHLSHDARSQLFRAEKRAMDVESALRVATATLDYFCIVTVARSSEIESVVDR